MNYAPLAFARSPAVLLHEEEQDNFVSDWRVVIVATCTKRRVVTLHARKWMKSRYPWWSVLAVREIRRPGEFIAGIRACEEALDVEVDWPAVIDSLRTLHPTLADTVREARPGPPPSHGPTPSSRASS